MLLVSIFGGESFATLSALVRSCTCAMLIIHVTPQRFFCVVGSVTEWTDNSHFFVRHAVPVKLLAVHEPFTTFIAFPLSICV